MIMCINISKETYTKAFTFCSMEHKVHFHYTSPVESEESSLITFRSLT